MIEMRFLIAEPSKGLQRYLRELFENFSFNPALIAAADTPDAALQIAERLKPDFLLSNWFPQHDLNGIALFQQAQRYNANCQFALLHNEAGPEYKERADKAGALFLLGTPCSALELRTALGSALKTLSVKNPRVDAHVEVDAIAARRHLAALNIAAHLTTFVPGEKIRYKGRTDAVKHVILRRGEMVVQLTSDDSLVPATAISKSP